MPNVLYYARWSWDITQIRLCAKPSILVFDLFIFRLQILGYSPENCSFIHVKHVHSYTRRLFQNLPKQENTPPKKKFVLYFTVEDCWRGRKRYSLIWAIWAILKGMVFQPFWPYIGYRFWPFWSINRVCVFWIRLELSMLF